MNGNSGQNAREPGSLDLWGGMNGEAVAEAAQRRVRRIEDFRQSGSEGW
jgi:hypothetical protein